MIWYFARLWYFLYNSYNSGTSDDVQPTRKDDFLNFIFIVEASRGAAAQSATVKPTGFGFDLHSRRWNIYLNLYFHLLALVSRQSAALNSVTQHAMPPEFGRKWETECLITRFPLLTLLFAGYFLINLFYLYLLLKLVILRMATRKCYSWANIRSAIFEYFLNYTTR